MIVPSLKKASKNLLLPQSSNRRLTRKREQRFASVWWHLFDILTHLCWLEMSFSSSAWWQQSWGVLHCLVHKMVTFSQSEQFYSTKAQLMLVSPVLPLPTLLFLLCGMIPGSRPSCDLQAWNRSPVNQLHLPADCSQFHPCQLVVSILCDCIFGCLFVPPSLLQQRVPYLLSPVCVCFLGFSSCLKVNGLLTNCMMIMKKSTFSCHLKPKI